jgi:L-lactate permease
LFVRVSSEIQPEFVLWVRDFLCLSPRSVVFRGNFRGGKCWNEAISSRGWKDSISLPLRLIISYILTTLLPAVTNLVVGPELWDISTDIVVLLVFAPLESHWKWIPPPVNVFWCQGQEKFWKKSATFLWSVRRRTLDTLDRNATHQHF